MKKYDDKILKELVQKYIDNHNKQEYWTCGYTGIVLNLKDSILFKMPSLSGKYNLAIYYPKSNKTIYMYECELDTNDIMDNKIDNSNFTMTINYNYKEIK